MQVEQSLDERARFHANGVRRFGEGIGHGLAFDGVDRMAWPMGEQVGNECDEGTREKGRAWRPCTWEV